MHNATIGVHAPDQRRGRWLVAMVATFATLLSLVAPFAPPAGAQDGGPTDVTVERLGGEDRFETAAMIATGTFETAGTVLIVRADDFPDALAGSYLTGQIGAPLLLTPQDELNDDTLDALEELETDEVILLGGTAAISPGVAQGFEDEGYEVDRIGGQDRFETAALVATDDRAENVGEVDGRPTAIVASGDDFPDALVVGGMAYAEEFPLLLTPQGELDDEARDALEDLEIEHVIIPGGPAAVADDVESAINEMDIATTRLAGERRTSTAAEVGRYAFTHLGWEIDHVNLARGDDFPDALALGPHAGEEVAPILLSWTPDALDAAAEAATADWLRAAACEATSIHIAGETAAISGAVADAAAAAAEDCDVALAAAQFDDTNTTARVHTVDLALTDLADVPIEDGEIVVEVHRDSGDGFELLVRETVTTHSAPAEAAEASKSGDRAGLAELTYNREFDAEDGDVDRIVACHRDGGGLTACTDDHPDRRLLPGGAAVVFAELNKDWVAFDVGDADIQLGPTELVNPTVETSDTVGDLEVGATLDGLHLGLFQVLDGQGRVVDDLGAYVDDLQIEVYRTYEGGDAEELDDGLWGASLFALTQSGDLGSWELEILGPDAADFADNGDAASATDEIFVCFPDPLSDSCAEIVFGEVQANPFVAGDSATVTWLNVHDPEETTYTGRVVDADLADGEGTINLFTDEEEFVAVEVTDTDVFTVDGQAAEPTAQRGDLLSVDYDPDGESSFELVTHTGNFLALLTGDAEVTVDLDDVDGIEPGDLDELFGEVPPNRAGGIGFAVFDTYTAGDSNAYCQQTHVAPGADGSSLEESPGAHLHDGGPDVNGPVVIGFEPVSDDAWASRDCGDAGDFDLDGFEADRDGFPMGFYVNVHSDAFPGGLVRGQTFEWLTFEGAGFGTAGDDGSASAERSVATRTTSHVGGSLDGGLVSRALR